MSDCQELVYRGFVPVPEDLDELSQHYAQGQVIHGGADINAVDVDGHAVESGDHGKNSTGIRNFRSHLPVKVISYLFNQL